VDSTNEPQDTIVLSTERHLKWEALDAVERVLMWLSGLLLFTFTTAVLVDVVTRTIGIPLCGGSLSEERPPFAATSIFS
jgi:hypothetical protein